MFTAQVTMPGTGHRLLGHAVSHTPTLSACCPTLPDLTVETIPTITSSLLFNRFDLFYSSRTSNERYIY